MTGYLPRQPGGGRTSGRAEARGSAARVVARDPAAQGALAALILLGVSMPAVAQPPPGRPHIDWPVSLSYRRLYPERVAILTPLFDRSPPARGGAVLTYAGGRLNALDPSDGHLLWPGPAACPARPILLGMDDVRFVLATPQRLFALGRADGKTRWHYGEEPPSDPAADPESFVAWTRHALTARRLFAASDRGELVCLYLRDGNVRWRRAIEAAADLLAADERRVLFGRRSGGRYRVTCLDAASGRRLHALDLPAGESVQALEHGPGGTLLAVGSKVIRSIGAAGRAVRWRIDTAGRFIPSTLCVGQDRLFVSDDGRRMSACGAEDGKRLWRSEPIGTDTGGGLWAALAGDRLIVASEDALVALDASEGRTLWKAHRPPGLRLQPPLITSDSVVTIEEEACAKKPRRPDGRNAPRAASTHRGRRYRVRRFELAGGKEMPVGAGGALVTEPVEDFGGLFAREHALILLDGDRLIGYGERENGE